RVSRLASGRHEGTDLHRGGWARSLASHRGLPQKRTIETSGATGGGEKMIAGQKVLAVVPARSGSKGIPDKNLQRLAGRTLIEQVARVLSHPDCGWIDRKIIS